MGDKALKLNMKKEKAVEYYEKHIRYLKTKIAIIRSLAIVFIGFICYSTITCDSVMKLGLSGVLKLLFNCGVIILGAILLIDIDFTFNADDCMKIQVATDVKK